MLLITTFIVCLAGGMIPLISADVYVVFAATMVSGGHLTALILVATFAQICGKVFTYAAGARALASCSYIFPIKWQGRLSRFQGGVVFLSALAGIPPFFMVAFACGATRASLPRFIIAASAGRLIHVTALALAPHALFGGVA